jgi:hypothetical protein
MHMKRKSDHINLSLLAPALMSTFGLITIYNLRLISYTCYCQSLLAPAEQSQAKMLLIGATIYNCNISHENNLTAVVN